MPIGSMRNSTFVVAQDFVVTPLIDSGQLVDSMQNFVELLFASGGTASSSQALLTLLKSNAGRFVRL
jgi:hypothetical protein